MGGWFFQSEQFVAWLHWETQNPKPKSHRGWAVWSFWAAAARVEAPQLNSFLRIFEHEHGWNQNTTRAMQWCYNLENSSYQANIYIQRPLKAEHNQTSDICAVFWRKFWKWLEWNRTTVIVKQHGVILDTELKKKVQSCKKCEFCECSSADITNISSCNISYS